MKTDFIPVAVLFHLALPLMAYLSVRNQRHEEKDGIDIFRCAPGAAWFILVGGTAIITVCGVIAWTAPPGREIGPLLLCVVEASFLLLALYGLYLVTMRIHVDDIGFTVTSLYGKRTVSFDQIGSVSDRVTGNYRTLDVKTVAGKRVLYLGSTFIPDYAALADFIQYGTKQRKTPRTN